MRDYMRQYCAGGITYRLEVLQEDTVGLEALIATGEAEQCCEGVAGSEKCDNKNR